VFDLLVKDIMRPSILIQFKLRNRGKLFTISWDKVEIYVDQVLKPKE